MSKLYSVQPRDWIYVKGDGFLSFSNNVGKNIKKTVSGKYSQKRLDIATNYGADALQTASKRTIQKIAETACYLIGKNVAVAAARNTSQSASSNSITSMQTENTDEIPGKINIPEKIQQTIDYTNY